VCGKGETITFCSPNKVFKRVDLPTFGFPMMVTFKGTVFNSMFLDSVFDVF